jgi:hypothetical protein
VRLYLWKPEAKTNEKIRFNPDLKELVPAEQLDWEFGGKYHLEFDHAEYWKTITE